MKLRNQKSDFENLQKESGESLKNLKEIEQKQKEELNLKNETIEKSNLEIQKKLKEQFQVEETKLKEEIAKSKVEFEEKQKKNFNSTQNL